MTLLVIFGTSFVVGLSGSLMPGPLLAITIPLAARKGFWVGPTLVLGHAVAEVAIVVALAVGLAYLVGSSWVAVIVGAVGGFVLILMGMDIMRNARHQEPLPEDGGLETGSLGGLHPVLSGLVASVANPTWIIWWATVGAAYVVWAREWGTLGLFSFYTGHILADLSWYSLVSLAVAGGRNRIPLGVYRGVLAVCGAFLVLLGAYFLFTALRPAL
jgi:threonine/homoserine/homoserine lactone efflux protein